ncbi:MAG: ABC transporter substrate-binding protein [Spirochaetales bacterium]|nr:ABC transporter substrate-binding protein [Spirochaetales bacterium]
MKIVMKKIVLAGVILGVLSCSGGKKTVDLGFIGGLSGGNADLGEAGRNGAIMAVEEVNEAGGIKGRQVKLIVKDDNNRPEKAREVAEELVGLEVEAIIGPLTSTTTKAAIEVTNEAQMVVASPTASAIQLAGIDDYLIRVCPSSRDNAFSYGVFMYDKLGFRKVSIVADGQNRVFSESWYGEFKSKWEEKGGEILIVEFVNTKEFSEYHVLTEKLLAGGPDGILFIANSVDSARLAQQIRKEDKDITFVAAEWAATQNLISLGGAAVDGLVSMQIVNFFDTSPRFLNFVAAYEERFGNYPSFSSIISYDAAMMVMKALELQGKESLKESILMNQPFEGLQMELGIDEYGDLLGQSTFVVVENREYALYR